MLVAPWGHRWNVLALTVITQAVIIGIQTYSFSFWIVPWAQEFSAPRAELMMIITASVIGTGLIAPWAGIALDRFPPRVLFCIGIALYALGLVLVSVASSHWMIMAVYAALMPIGLVFCGNLGSQTLVTRWFHENRGTALGISALGVSFGAFAIPPFATALLSAFGWRAAFQAMGVGTLVLLAPLAWWLLNKRPDVAVSSPSKTARQIQNEWSTTKLLANRDFLIIAGGFAAILIAVLPIVFSVGAFANDIGVTPRAAALCASAAAIALALGKIGFGRLADVISHRWLYRWAGATIVTGIVITSFAESVSGLMIGLALTNLGQGAYLPLLSSMVVARFGTAAFGQVMGLATILIQSSALSPILAGFIRDLTGSYSKAFLVTLAPLVIAVVAMQWLSDERASPEFAHPIQR